MKKLLSIICITLMIGATANKLQAQTTGGLGFRGGVNIANLNDVDNDNIDSRTGIMLGAYYNNPISNSPVSIQPEVLYTQKGFEIGSTTYQLDYIEIPVLARFDFITDSGLLPHVYFGPSIGFNINAETDGDDGLFEGDDNLEDNVKSTELGVVVGAGLDFGRVNLGVRYGAGLTEAFENGNGKNGVFSIIAGVGF